MFVAVIEKEISVGNVTTTMMVIGPTADFILLPGGGKCHQRSKEVATGEKSYLLRFEIQLVFMGPTAANVAFTS